MLQSIILDTVLCYTILLLYIIYKCSVFIIDGCGVWGCIPIQEEGQSCSG